MSHFKEFCDSIPKNKHGYVPDLLDMDNDDLRDMAMAAFIADLNGVHLADRYIKSYDKNDVYSSYESRCQDAIDAYNQGIDDARENSKNLELMADHTFISLIDPNYKYRNFNQEMYDSGMKPSDFC